jgi:hypothetical protein
LAFASTVLQSVYVFGALNVLEALHNYQIMILFSSSGHNSIEKKMADAFIQFVPFAVTGLLGVLLTWVLLRKLNYRPMWFLFVTRFFAVTWLVFLPIGTVLAGLMFFWVSASKNSVRGSTQHRVIGGPLLFVVGIAIFVLTANGFHWGTSNVPKFIEISWLVVFPLSVVLFCMGIFRSVMAVIAKFSA